MVLSLLAASFTLMELADWEPGRFDSTNGWFSVTGHGGGRHVRMTRESFAVKPGATAVFEAETFQPRNYDGSHNAEFWFVCFDGDGGKTGPGRVCNILDSKLPEGADGWRRVRLEMASAPPGTKSIRIASGVVRHRLHARHLHCGLHH